MTILFFAGVIEASEFCIGDIFYGGRDFARALKEYELASKKDESRVDFFKMGFCYDRVYGEAKRQETINCFIKAANTDDRYRSSNLAYYNAGLLLSLDNDIGGAGLLFRVALNANKQDIEEDEIKRQLAIIRKKPDYAFKVLERGKEFKDKNAIMCFEEAEIAGSSEARTLLWGLLSADKLIDRGDAFYNKEDYANALKEYELASKKDESRVDFFKMGFCYDRVYGAAKRQEAIHCFIKAANTDDRYRSSNLAYYNVGLLLSLDNDIGNAALWFRAALNANKQIIKEDEIKRQLAIIQKKPGYADAQYKMGKEFFDKKVANAVICFEEAADLGHTEAEFMLGKIYMDGPWDIKNHRKAKTFLDKAATKNHRLAQYHLAFLYEKGPMEFRNYAMAGFLYKKAGVKDTQDELKSVRKEPSYAAAQIKLGNHFYAEKDFQSAFLCYEEAALLGNSDALYQVGIMYLDGQGIPKNIKEAEKNFQKASEKGHIEASYKLAYLYEGSDTDKAYLYYKKAGDKGHKDALSWLAMRDAEKQNQVIQRFKERDNQGALTIHSKMYKKPECYRLQEVTHPLKLVKPIATAWPQGPNTVSGVDTLLDTDWQPSEEMRFMNCRLTRDSWGIVLDRVLSFSNLKGLTMNNCRVDSGTADDLVEVLVQALTDREFTENLSIDLGKNGITVLTIY